MASADIHITFRIMGKAKEKSLGIDVQWNY